MVITKLAVFLIDILIISLNMVYNYRYLKRQEKLHSELEKIMKEYKEAYKNKSEEIINLRTKKKQQIKIMM